MKTIRSALRHFRELKALGTFDNESLFRCHSKEKAPTAIRLISLIVSEFDDVVDEWETFTATLTDLGPDQVVRVIPADLQALEGELMRHRDMLVYNDVVHRIRYARDKYLAAANIIPFDDALQGVKPSSLDDKMELSAILDRLYFGVQEVAWLEDRHRESVRKAYERADSDNFFRSTLAPNIKQMSKAVDQDYEDALECLLEPTYRAMPEQVIEAARRAEQKHASPFVTYLGGSFRELFGVDEHDQADEARMFLIFLLDYWEDLACDEDRFEPALVRKGERAIPRLRQLAETASLFHLSSKELFRPENWKNNLQVLRPITLASPRLNAATRNLIQQIYASFVFGQWSAVIALCRAVTEHVTKDRLKARRVSLTYPPDRTGRAKEKSLDALVDDLISQRPNLEPLRKDFDEIREHGNKAMHRAPSLEGGENVVDAEQRFRSAALVVVLCTKRVLEALYEINQMGE